MYCLLELLKTDQKVLTLTKAVVGGRVLDEGRGVGKIFEVDDVQTDVVYLALDWRYHLAAQELCT